MILQTPRLRLAMPHNPSAMASYFARNWEHLASTSPSPPAGFFTEEYWKRRLIDIEVACDAGREARWALAPIAAPEQVIGVVNLTQISRGPLQACYLGYSIDRRWEGRGLMGEAVSAVLDHAFTVLRLHRVMANHLPDNHRSARLLARLGFRTEGYAPSYLYLNGAWRDHVLTARVNPDADAPPAG